MNPIFSLRNSGHLPIVQTPHVGAIENVVSTIKGIEKTSDIEECCLARARRSHDRDELTRFDGQGEFTQRMGFDMLGAVDLVQVGHSNHVWFSSCSSSCHSSHVLSA